MRRQDRGASRRTATAFALAALVAAPALAARASADDFGDTGEPIEIVSTIDDRLEPAVRRLIRRKVETLESSRRDPEAWGDLGLVYEANLMWSLARACFEQAVALAPGESAWRLHLAIATREAGDFKGALQQLRAVAASNASLPSAQQQLGLAQLAIGEFDGALEAFSRLVGLDAAEAVGYVGAADALLGMGQAQRAIQMIDKALALEPWNRGARHRRGLALREIGRLEEAERELTLGVGAAQRLLPLPHADRLEDYAVHITARVGRAAGLLASGRPAAALEILETCLADHPDNVTVLNNLAIASLHLGDLRRARSLLDRALAINEGKFSTWINLTSWALRVGDVERALEFADAAVVRGPDSAQAHASRAQVLWRLGRLEQAATDFESAAELEASDPRPRLAAAELNRRLGRADRARAFYLEAIDRQADLLPAFLGLCRLELDLGRFQAAQLALEDARKIAPDHPQVAELELRLRRERPGG